MPQTKIEIFKIEISNNQTLDLDKKAHDAINDFLTNENNIYLNHSSSILTENVEEYGINKTINRFLVISLVYKDLNASSFNLKNTTKKTRKIVTKEIENGDIIPEPIVETDLDKDLKRIKKNHDERVNTPTS